MPKGSPNAQTKASAKYHAKIGLVSKSFKLKKELVEEFKKVCEETNVTQSGQIAKMMKEFIETHRQDQ